MSEEMMNGMMEKNEQRGCEMENGDMVMDYQHIICEMNDHMDIIRRLKLFHIYEDQVEEIEMTSLKGLMYLTQFLNGNPLWSVLCIFERSEPTYTNNTFIRNEYIKDCLLMITDDLNISYEDILTEAHKTLLFTNARDSGDCQDVEQYLVFIAAHSENEQEFWDTLELSGLSLENYVIDVKISPNEKKISIKLRT